MDGSGVSDVVANLTGECPISVQIPVLKSLVKKKTFKCAYYDEATNSYKNDGVKY